MTGKDTVIYRSRACKMTRIRLKCATYWRVAQSIRIFVCHKARHIVLSDNTSIPQIGNIPTDNITTNVAVHVVWQ
jgi:hypothetical protein